MNSLVSTSHILATVQQYFLVIALVFLAACQLDPVFDDDIERFNKIYAVTQQVEAVDVVEKMDGTGYLIIGHVKTTTDSDLILIDAGLDGMQKNYQRIDTEFYDEAVALKIYEEEQSVYILGNRRDNATSSQYSNILVKANLDGNLIQLEINDTTTSTEVKLLESVDNYSIKMNDFLINPPFLIFTGQINQSGISHKFNQIYNLQSFNFNIAAAPGEEIEKLHQIPLSLSSLTSNTRNLHINKSDFPGSIYTVYGQADGLTDPGLVATPATPIWEIFTALETQAGLNPDLKATEDLSYGFALKHSNKKTYFAGNLVGVSSLFLISAEYNNSETSTAQIELNDSIKGDGLNDFLGSPRVSSMLEDKDGNIIMAVYVEVEEQSITNNSISYLLKFSPSALQIEDQQIIFNSTGLNNIKKVIMANDGSILLLSQLIFENNSMAIGLTKIKF